MQESLFRSLKEQFNLSVLFDEKIDATLIELLSHSYESDGNTTASFSPLHIFFVFKIRG